MKLLENQVTSKSKILICTILLFILSIASLTGCDQTEIQETIDDISYLGDRSAEGLMRDTKKEMYKIAKDIICDNISTPSTAEFPAFDSSYVTNNGSIYTVSAYVDAENLMGAMVRNKFTIEIEKTDTGYKYTILSME